MATATAAAAPSREDFAAMLEESFGSGEMQVMNLDNPHVLGFVRQQGNERLLVFANFSEQPQTLPANCLRLYGLSYTFSDLLNEKSISCADLALGPCQFMVLKSSE